MNRTIEIIVSPEGRSTVQTLGFVGPSCRDASRFVEKALGKQTAETLTTEFQQTESARQVNRQQNG